MGGKIGDDILYYIAGFFDGEGSISFHKGKTFSIEICIANTNKEVIEFIHKSLGLGYIDVSRPKKPNWSVKFSLRIRNIDEAERFLSLIKDKVIVKRGKVEEALKRIADYRKLVAEYEEMKRRVTELYRSGVPVKEIATMFGISKQRVCQIAREYGLVRHWHKGTKILPKPTKPRPQSWGGV